MIQLMFLVMPLATLHLCFIIPYTYNMHQYILIDSIYNNILWYNGVHRLKVGTRGLVLFVFNWETATLHVKAPKRQKLKFNFEADQFGGGKGKRRGEHYFNKVLNLHRYLKISKDPPLKCFSQFDCKEQRCFL